MHENCLTGRDSAWEKFWGCKTRKFRLEYKCFKYPENATQMNFEIKI